MGYSREYLKTIIESNYDYYVCRVCGIKTFTKKDAIKHAKLHITEKVINNKNH